ncbi:Hypothetical predicted protein [Mytilus galloprovincialis]|uniref:ATPase AAA-type core domain-containing protein n=1 Tax=Mytilus galloprovincialis TaxID=29158 RepID=A0A8B6EC55_MYTGA|nr:Hypothetical predicted protein [Mytilus galloprovincialis]
MIRSIAMHNFVHFHEEQRLVFEEGANFLIGGNSTGKTALFELIRRCYSNKINTTTSSVLNENELAYAVCHFTVPEQYPPIEKLELSKMVHPKDILACIFIKSQGCQPENIAKDQANGYDCYKVICSISSTGSIQTFAQKFIGSYGCYTKQLDDNTKGCKRISSDKSAIDDVKFNGNKKNIHYFYNIIASDFESTTTGSSDGALTIMNALYDWLEKGYVGILPMRSIGPLQWTKSELNQHDSRDKNYENADRRAEILSNLLDNDLLDKKQETFFHNQIVHPYEFIKLNGKVEVRNTDRKDLISKRLLKTPEGILEGKQLTLILSHKEFSTITIEEPDRGMHPHMIKKMRDFILKHITGKTVLIITHNPSMLDKWAMARTFVSSKTILNETVCHSISKVPEGYVKLYECEEIKNLLFSSRILFVEGKTDKIVLEAIFRLLIYDENAITTEQKHFLQATDIRELAGAGDGEEKKKFCTSIDKEIYLLYDSDKKIVESLDVEKDQNTIGGKRVHTFQWKVGALEQRFIDVLDNCYDENMIDRITEVFRIKLQKDDENYNSISEYINFRKQIIKIKTGEEQACNTASPKSPKIRDLPKCIRYTKRKIITRLKKKVFLESDSSEMEIIAAAMIQYSEEVKEFIDFLQDDKFKKGTKTIKRKLEKPEDETTTIQTSLCMDIDEEKALTEV